MDVPVQAYVQSVQCGVAFVDLQQASAQYVVAHHRVKGDSIDPIDDSSTE